MLAVCNDAQTSVTIPAISKCPYKAIGTEGNSVLKQSQEGNEKLSTTKINLRAVLYSVHFYKVPNKNLVVVQATAGLWCLVLWSYAEYKT